mmetsp:Transcript_39562/g.29218  ORF Transcript_39562/g.29218 Transcript_39562/m.29218 type:complete len:139 (+) Transcript_39562:119-535(+)
MHTDSENFNLYELGTSNPNAIKPREFKHLYRNVPIEVSNEHLKRLQQLTGNSNHFLKKQSAMQDYVGYNSRQQATRDTDSRRSKSVLGGTVKKEEANPEEQRDEFGRKKRKRFNEGLDEVMSKKSGMSLTAYQNTQVK